MSHTHIISGNAGMYRLGGSIRMAAAVEFRLGNVQALGYRSIGIWEAWHHA